MTKTTLFKSNRSQAVRLPKDVAFPEGVKEVRILRDGKRRVIVPASAVWDDYFDAPGSTSGRAISQPFSRVNRSDSALCSGY